MFRAVRILFPLLLLASCSPGDHHWERVDYPSEFVSNGQRIYFIGRSLSGSPIIANTGDSMMGHHRQMHGGGCAGCHGINREGERLWPQFWIHAPALTASALLSDDHAEHGHGDHGGYDDGTLRKAISDGLRPNGDALDGSMPRWSMSKEDLDDLVSYLMSSD